MSHALDVLLLILGLIVGIWMILFGLLGLILSGRAGVQRPVGALIGIALGPIGAAWLLWRSRHYSELAPRRKPSSDDADSDESGLLF
jgi:hypothetical protein